MQYKNDSFNFTVINNSLVSDDYLLINGFNVDDDQLSIFLTLTLFMFFFFMGYKEKKRSGGALMLLSGFCLLSFEALAVLFLSSFYIIPLLTPVSIFIIMLGIRKLYYKPSGENTNSEGT